MNRRDPVRERVRELASTFSAYRQGIDAELAELREDSLLTGSGTRGVRGTDTWLVTFEAPSVNVVVEVTDIGEHHQLVGQMIPVVARELCIEHPAGRTTVDVNEQGLFSVDRVSAGPVRIAMTLPGGGTVGTHWVTINSSTVATATKIQASRSAGWVAELAARMLPPAERPRWAEEFRSELYEIAASTSRRGQLAYALRLLSQGWDLRSAVTQGKRRTAGLG